MSGVPIIGKVFEEVERGVKYVGGQVIEAHEKAFDVAEKGFKHAVSEIDKNPLLKAIVVVAIVYFTVGAAVQYFSASAATTGVAAGSQSAMLASQTAAFGAEGAALTAQALASNAAVGAAAAGTAAAAVPAATTGAATTGAATAGAEAGASVAAGGEAAGGIGGWISANPVQATLLGQAGVGAAQGYAAGEAAKDNERSRREAEERAYAEAQRVRDERGLFGFDKDGNYGGSSGIIGSNVQGSVDEQGQPANAAATQTGTGATAAPIIAGQQVASVAPIKAPTVAVQRSELPKLNPRR